MSKTDSKPTPERVRALLDYDKATGVLTWRVQRGRVRRGSVAGWENDGYMNVGVDGRLFRAHVIAFVIVEGRWPVGDIDHENHAKADNRWTNLREVPHSVNLQNRAGPVRTNKTGFLGVSMSRGKFKASIARADGTTKMLGRFATGEEASAAYQAAKAELHTLPGTSVPMFST